jgi:hypothetical protein
MKITKEDLRQALEVKEKDYRLQPVFEDSSGYPIRMNQIAVQAFVWGERPEDDLSLRYIHEMLWRLKQEGAMRYDT